MQSERKDFAASSADTAGRLREPEAERSRLLAQIQAQQDELRRLRAEIDARAGMPPDLPAQLRAFEELVAREIDLSNREQREFAVVFIGIDPEPSAAPEAEAMRRTQAVEAFDGMLRANTRAMDAPTRIDDAGFALLLSGVGLATAHARMDGLRRHCATQVLVQDGEGLHFSVSMGVASYPHTVATRSGLLLAARAALAQARQRGGDQVVLASIALAAASPGPLQR